MVKQAHLKCLMFGFLFLFLMDALADTPVKTLGDMAKMITGSFGSITKMVIGLAYVGGIGFSLGAIMKFRQHKDNPTQIPVGTPIAMLFVASALLFFPTVLSITGKSIFGTTVTGGPSGIIWGS